LEVSNLRELEDLIIEVVYADIIRGKLDQKHQQLEVDYAIGRDIKPENIGEIISVLQDWCHGCEALLVNIEQQVKRSNEQKNDNNKQIQTIEAEVANIKKTLKATHQQDIEEQMSIDLPSTTDKAGKKSAKTKGGLRGSSSTAKTTK
jgi:COP9 signalosome complex subunit 7